MALSADTDAHLGAMAQTVRGHVSARMEGSAQLQQEHASVLLGMSGQTAVLLAQPVAMVPTVRLCAPVARVPPVIT